MTEKQVKRSIWKFEKRLLAIKFVYFWSHAATAALIPFFVTYYFEWGLTPTELSIIPAAVTATSFVIRPIIGRIADGTKHYRTCFAICLLWCAALHVPHMYIPKMPPSYSSFNKTNQSLLVIGNLSFNSSSALPDDNLVYLESRDDQYIDDDSQYIIPWIPQKRLEIFLALLVLRVFASLGQSPSLSLSDTFGYALSQSDQRLWGRLRCWSTFGWAFATLSIGYFLHVAQTHYHLFIISGAMYTAAAISVAFLSPLYQHNTNFQSEESSKHQVCKLICQPAVFIYLVFTVINGTLLAMEYNFLFLFLKENGADELLIGLHQLVDSAVELPMFFFSGHIITKIGYAPCFCLSFAAYVIRLTSYSLLGDPLYLVLIIELVHGFSFTLFLAAGSGYADLLTPPGFNATLQGIFHSFYFSLGIGVGELMGSYLYPVLGAKLFFRCGAGLAALSSLFYFLLWLVWLRKVEKQKLAEKSLPKDETDRINALVSGHPSDWSATAFDINRIDMAHIDDTPSIEDCKSQLMDREEAKIT